MDVLRLLQAAETSLLAATIQRLMQTEVARDVTREALDMLKENFMDARSAGSQMAVRAVGALRPAAVIAESCAALTSDLLRALGRMG